jgi:hypothetical protein
MSSEDRLVDRDSQRRRRSAERVAFNDNLFRRANESIKRSATEIGAEIEHVPFICECAEESCTTVIPVPRDEYERVRSDPRLFLNAPGHHAAAQGWAKVVERHAQYVVVEKIGRAGEIAEMLDE